MRAFRHRLSPVVITILAACVTALAAEGPFDRSPVTGGRGNCLGGREKSKPELPSWLAGQWVGESPDDRITLTWNTPDHDAMSGLLATSDATGVRYQMLVMEVVKSEVLLVQRTFSEHLNASTPRFARLVQTCADTDRAYFARRNDLKNPEVSFTMGADNKLIVQTTHQAGDGQTAKTTVILARR